MNTFKLIPLFLLFILFSFQGKSQSKTQLISNSWTFDIENMLQEVPQKQRVAQRKVLNSMQVIYSFEPEGAMDVKIMGENMAEGAFWQFSEDENLLYLTNIEGITEELEIIELNSLRLTLKDSKGKQLFFVPYRIQGK